MLNVNNVSITFGGVRALDGISFDVPDREICGLIGPNGAGKTTLFNCITRIYEPVSGTIGFDGAALLDTAPHKVIERGIARTFQNLALFPSMSILENTIVGMHSRHTASAAAALVGWPSTRRRHRHLEAEARDILGDLGLGDLADHPAAGLPFGTLKLVELARAVASHPKLLLLDEPAGGLTHEEVQRLGETIVQIRDRFDLSVLLVEHHMGLVMGISEHVVVMNFGKKIADGAPDEVRENESVIAAYLGGPD